MKSFLKSVFILALFAAAFGHTAAVYGQGNLKGMVTDSLTGKPLVGANVYLAGTSLGDATDLEGLYRIEQIPAGAYTLKVSYLGYRTTDIPVRVGSGSTETVSAALVADAIKGKTVVIRGQAVGQAAAINQQITSNTIVNVISEEKIKELPDANAAEAVGRLPGVSILRSGGEANKVILRGLEDKFTLVTINGVKVPATDATSRGVDLSILSQSSLTGIELYKAVTSDKDGDALAGSINMVTKKAPEKRLVRADIKGNYNRLMKSADQYDGSFHYGERFFGGVLGLQVMANAEKRIRSNERIDVNYNQSLSDGTDYFINDFSVEFTDEIRKRDGGSLLLDVNTPDGGSVRFNNMFGRTRRSYFLSTRDYPSNGGGDQQGNPTFNYRDREQELQTFSSSVTGDNSLIGLHLNWGVSYGQSDSEFPFDYETIFVEPSGMAASPMFHTRPEQLIGYAMNNFSEAALYWAYDRRQDNSDKEKTAFLDVARQYRVGPYVSGELKVGGKYKSRDRSNRRAEDFTPYYLGRWQQYELLPDGTHRLKDFTGTPFKEWLDAGGGFISLSRFFPGEADSRKVYGSYTLTPLITRNWMRQWYNLNRYGVDVTKNQSEIWGNPLIRYDDYDVTESVGAGYFMNTLNIGQVLTVIAGLRVESENNDYVSNYMPKSVAGFPVPSNSIKDTASSADQTVLLPNVNVAWSPLPFMKWRVAAYKALARPDFNMRLERYIAGRPAEVGGRFEVWVGNPNLKTATAWNFEINPTFYTNTLGLISFSAYYKEINDMYHMLNRFNTIGDSLLHYFDIGWASQMKKTAYDLTLPYNSPKPAKVWGFEFEHQIALKFLPGPARHFILSYNASAVRSEAVLFGSKTVTWVDSSGLFPLTKSKNVLVERKQKLEGMPEFFGNVSLGYDIGDFSARVSVFHQGEHNVSYSANGLSDLVTNAFTRVDLAVKQGITKNLSVFVNVSNLTDVEDGSSIVNRVHHRKLFNQSEKYGVTADFGITAQL
ncbi:MAG: TonB-dependent receptor [bacterium]|nr:TonB-dependent receptor [bacterium]